MTCLLHLALLLALASPARAAPEPPAADTEMERTAAAAQQLMSAHGASPDTSTKPVPAEYAGMVSVASSMGELLFQMDTSVAAASDAMLEAGLFPKEDRYRGWLTVVQKDGVHVLFMGESRGKVGVLYHLLVDPVTREVGLAEGGAFPPPRPEEMAIPSPQLMHLWKARELALRQDWNAFTRSYNVEVIDMAAVTGSAEPQVWVYLLAATDDPDVVLVGGHSTVMLEGQPLQLDAIFPHSLSLLSLSRSELLPPGDGFEQAGLFVTHLTTETPLDTHVFTSLRYGIDLYVLAGGNLWFVQGKEIRFLGPLPEVEAPAEPAGRKSRREP